MLQEGLFRLKFVVLTLTRSKIDITENCCTCVIDNKFF